MQASVKWDGALKFTGTNKSGQQMKMDGEGGATAPSPMECALMAAGGCSSVDVVSMLEEAGGTVTGCEVKLSSERAESAPRVFEKIELHFVVTGSGITEDQVADVVTQSMVKYCSVALTMNTAKLSWTSELVLA